MKPTPAFLLFIFCGIALITCKNTTSTTIEETPSEFATVVIDDELVTGDMDSPSVFIPASTLQESEFSKTLEELVFYEKPKTSEDEPDENENITEFTKLYPLGWSKDGNFAYVTYSNTYEMGHQMTYVIQNMNSGDTLWNKQITYGMMEKDANEDEYNWEDVHEVILIKGDESEAKLFKYAWMMQEKVVLSALKKAGIMLNSSGEFLKRPNYQDVSFEIEEVQREEDEENPNQYFLKSNKFEHKLLWKDYFPVNEMKVAGIIKSPYSETIVVVCKQNRQFFEMTYVTVPFLTGYKLN